LDIVQKFGPLSEKSSPPWCPKLVTGLGMLWTEMYTLLTVETKVGDHVLMEQTTCALHIPQQTPACTSNVLEQRFPIFFWLAPPFLINKFLSPPYHAQHTYQQNFFVLYIWDVWKWLKQKWAQRCISL